MGGSSKSLPLNFSQQKIPTFWLVSSAILNCHKGSILQRRDGAENSCSPRFDAGCSHSYFSPRGVEPSGERPRSSQNSRSESRVEIVLDHSFTGQAPLLRDLLRIRRVHSYSPRCHA